jgi:hypothetical protein
MRAEPQGVYVHSRRLSAIHVAEIWAGVGAGPCDGIDHGGDASGCIRWVGIGGGEVAGFSGRVSGGDDLDWSGSGCVVSHGGGVDGGAGGCGVKVDFGAVSTTLPSHLDD